MKARWHEDQYEAIRRRYGPHMLSVIMALVWRSTWVSGGVNAVMIPLGFWDFDPTVFVLSMMVGLSVVGAADYVRAKTHYLLAGYHASVGQIPHMRA